MVLVCILSTIVVSAIVLYSICATSSTTNRHIEKRALRLLPPSFAKSFDDLLAQGDVENVYRIMKALEKRGDIQIVETEYEIIITRPESVSEDQEKIQASDRMA
jgi:hypothetical protein